MGDEERLALLSQLGEGDVSNTTFRLPAGTLAVASRLAAHEGANPIPWMTGIIHRDLRRRLSTDAQHTGSERLLHTPERLINICRWHSLSLFALSRYVPGLTLQTLADPMRVLYVLESEGGLEELEPGAAQVLPHLDHTASHVTVLQNLCAIFATRADWIVGVDDRPAEPHATADVHDFLLKVLYRTIDPQFQHFDLQPYFSGSNKNLETLTITVQYTSPVSPSWRLTERVLYSSNLDTVQQREQSALAWTISQGMTRNLSSARLITTPTAHRLRSGHQHPMSVHSEAGAGPLHPTALIPAARLRDLVGGLSRYITYVSEEQRDDILRNILKNNHLDVMV